MTLVGVNPALDLEELAVELRAKAEANAHEQGRGLAEARVAGAVGAA